MVDCRVDNGGSQDGTPADSFPPGCEHEESQATEVEDGGRMYGGGDACADNAGRMPESLGEPLP